MVLAVSTFDDRFLARFLPIRAPATGQPSLAPIGAGILVAILSIQPIRNMLSAAEVMNTVYNRFHLVGTYGAFGSITRPRYEVIVEGTDESVLTASTKWREYEFKGKPGSLGRMPPQIAPYHLRLDWLMWFAAMSSYEEQPWFAPFMQKLLEGCCGPIGWVRISLRVCGAELQLCAGPPGPAQADVDVGRRTGVLPHHC